MANDKPAPVTLTFKALESQVPQAEPFIYATKTGKRITFPDIGAMEAEAADEMMHDLEATSGTMGGMAFVQKWLPKGDYEALRKDKLTVNQLAQLVGMVMRHYQAAVGDAGEGSAS